MAATRRLAAIMFTDMVGYTAAAQTDEAAAIRLRDEQEALVRPLFAAHQGRVIKSMGDGFLAEFDSALRAVECAIDIQQHLHERNSQPGVAPIRLRIGVHLGDVEQRGGDIFGDAVNIASRVEPLAPPDGLCITGQVFDQVRNKISNRFDRLAPRALKNVRIPIEIYQVTLPWDHQPPASPSVDRSHLAVLPLANISPDPKDEYFADGLTEELITTLSKIHDLRVIARTSVGQYKSTTKTVAQIGVELGVAWILEGSVRKSGNRLRITLQLIDAVTQSHIWANSYDRELDDVFAVQTEIAERTASTLRLELLGPERESIRREPTTNFVAYDLYLKGIHAARTTGHGLYEALTDAIPYFEQAIRSDPDYCQPYAQLAHTLISLAGDVLPADQAFPRARELIRKALELDPDSSEAHTARGNLALQYDNDWATSEAEFERAISLNPSDANAHYWYAYLLRAVGRFDESLKEFKTTIELDPLWPTAQLSLWMVQCQTGDFASAIASAEMARDREPDNPNMHVSLAFVYAEAGRLADVLREIERSAGPAAKWSEWTRAILWARAGRPEEARRILAEMEETSRTRYVSPAWIAETYAALGEKEKAFEWLERNNGEGIQSLWFRYQESAFDSIRGDPRFKAMLARVHLPTEPNWARGGGVQS